VKRRFVVFAAWNAGAAKSPDKPAHETYLKSSENKLQNFDASGKEFCRWRCDDARGAGADRQRDIDVVGQDVVSIAVFGHRHGYSAAATFEGCHTA
jgi:hypothetical protein